MARTYIAAVARRISLRRLRANRGRSTSWAIGWAIGCAALLLSASERATAQCELPKLLASDAGVLDQFGYGVSLFGDIAVVGAATDLNGSDATGSATVFRRVADVWVEEQKLLALDGADADFFGSTVAYAGFDIVIGAPGANTVAGADAGAIYVFRFDGTTWQQVQKLLANDGAANVRLGHSVSTWGDLIIAGAPHALVAGQVRGAAYVYRRSAGVWSQQVKLTATDGAEGDELGSSVAVSVDHAVIGARFDDDAGTNSGSAYVFRTFGFTWVQNAKLVAFDGVAIAEFGGAVAIDGLVAAIGAPLDDDSGGGSGSVYMYRKIGSAWTFEQKLVAFNGTSLDIFGYAVAVTGSELVVGAPLDNQFGTYSGSVYLFRLLGPTWEFIQKVAASDTVADDRFGYAVAANGVSVLIGSVLNDEAALNAGAAYVFDNVDCNNDAIPDVCLAPNPIITLAPVAAEVCVGASVEFEVAGQGVAPYSYEWRRDGVVIASATATASIFALREATIDDAGVYDAIVYDQCGAVISDGVTLTVLAPASVIDAPTSVVTCEGTAASFTVLAAGELPISYQWQKDGVPVVDATTASLSFAAVTAADAGVYTVIVTNSCGAETSAPASLTVLAHVQIIEAPTGAEVCVGADVTLSVTAIGAAPLSYTWFHDDVAIGGATGATLELSDVDLADGGSYRVEVANSCNTVASKPVTLTIDEPPSIEVEPVGAALCAGAPLTLSVTASGTAPLSYQWQRNGVDIRGATSDTLEFPATAESDSGNYQVVITNICGSATSATAVLAINACFYRGDANFDGFFNIADPIRTLEYLFDSVPVPCIRALDANDSEAIDIADAVYLLTSLFLAGPLPPPPFASCGVDPTPGALTCVSFPPCAP
ncbi:MAG: immunoglobulin domain-containing protein [Planctomycetota bacterium]